MTSKIKTVWVSVTQEWQNSKEGDFLVNQMFFIRKYGATSPVIYRSDIFETYSNKDFKGSHTVANGKAVQAIGKGKFMALADVAGNKQIINSNDVRYTYVYHKEKSFFSVLAAQHKVSNSTISLDYIPQYVICQSRVLLSRIRKKHEELYI